MLLTISTTHQPATDLGFLLHKHPERCQSFELSFGNVHVFYPRADEDGCTACLLLDVDPVGLVRGKGGWSEGLLDQYVNDRPFVASSLMSVAISQVFGSALAGRSKERADLSNTPIPLSARLDVLPVRGGNQMLERMFEPLGYSVTATRHPLDEAFSEWGEGPYYSVQLEAVTTVAQLLQHLYVLIPVFDGKKHYYIGPEEVEKLLSKGETWLSDHPERDFITRRYLIRKQSLIRQALARLVQEEGSEDGEAEGDAQAVLGTGNTEMLDREQSLHEQRLGAVLAVIRSSGAQRVLDLGCGDGKLLHELLGDQQFTEIVGMDVSIRSLEIAHRRLKLDRLPERHRERIRLIHGALTYRDERLANFDAAAIVEVVEHLDPSRLKAFERVVFQHARPWSVVLTTPNREYNQVWESLSAGELRHADHRFEWSRSEFQEWARGVGEHFGYSVQFLPVGPEAPELGTPSQMCVFRLNQPHELAAEV
jgi:3' terminal RNA ribose 2'-O-methyltransferase Hen1